MPILHSHTIMQLTASEKGASYFRHAPADKSKTHRSKPRISEIVGNPRKAMKHVKIWQVSLIHTFTKTDSVFLHKFYVFYVFVIAMFTTTNSRGRPFGPDGCQVPVGLGTCGETGTLDIINEFKRLYEEKMHEIDTAGGGDCLQVCLCFLLASFNTRNKRNGKSGDCGGVVLTFALRSW